MFIILQEPTCTCKCSEKILSKLDTLENIILDIYNHQLQSQLIQSIPSPLGPLPLPLQPFIPPNPTIQLPSQPNSQSTLLPSQPPVPNTQTTPLPSASYDLNYSPNDMELLMDLDLSTIDNSSTDFNTINIFQIRNTSCSRKNLCANLVRELFTHEEMKTSNVKGVLGKHQLDPNKMQFVEKTAFQLFPLQESETIKKPGPPVEELSMRRVDDLIENKSTKK